MGDCRPASPSPKFFPCKHGGTCSVKLLSPFGVIPCPLHREVFASTSGGSRPRSLQKPLQLTAWKMTTHLMTTTQIEDEKKVPSLELTGRAAWIAIGLHGLGRSSSRQIGTLREHITKVLEADRGPTASCDRTRRMGDRSKISAESL